MPNSTPKTEITQFHHPFCLIIVCLSMLLQIWIKARTCYVFPQSWLYFVLSIFVLYYCIKYDFMFAVFYKDNRCWTIANLGLKTFILLTPPQNHLKTTNQPNRYEFKPQADLNHAVIHKHTYTPPSHHMYRNQSNQFKRFYISILTSI